MKKILLIYIFIFTSLLSNAQEVTTYYFIRHAEKLRVDKTEEKNLPEQLQRPQQFGGCRRPLPRLQTPESWRAALRPAVRSEPWRRAAMSLADSPRPAAAWRMAGRGRQLRRPRGGRHWQHRVVLAGIRRYRAACNTRKNN